MSNIAIIPARGGSKRIPHKNIKNFLGKPMISYAIDAAKESGIFSHIVVSTDDEEIATIAKKCGAEVPHMRPKELADDYTPSGAVIANEITWLKEHNITADYYCCIYATVPLIRSFDIKACIEEMIKTNKARGYTLCNYPFPIWRSCYVKNGVSQPIWPENMPKRSQDLPEAFHDAGLFYWGTGDAWTIGKPEFYSDKTLAYIVPRYLVVDIDTPEDWHSAELMYQVLKLKEQQSE